MTINKQNDSVSVLAVGDLMFGVCALDYAPTNLTLPNQVSRRKELFDDKVIDHFKAHDCRIGNLECVITRQAQEYGKKKLIGPFESLDYLQQLDFDVLSLANNHVNDYGQEYVEETKQLLRSVGIDYLYSRETNEDIVVRKVSGKSIAFIGYGLKPYYYVETDNSDDADKYKDLDFYLGKLRNMDASSGVEPLSGGNIAPLLKTVQDARALDVDFIVLYIHWGFAYARFPSLFQIEIAHLLVDAGVDVILGSHPHVIQPIEHYKGKTIFYSLGNFLFDMWRDAASNGLMVSLDVGEEIAYECFLSIRRKDLGVMMRDGPMDVARTDMTINGQRCEFAYLSSYSDHLDSMQEVVNDPVKYFHYRRSCARHKSAREYFLSSLPIRTKVSRFIRRT